MPSSRSGGSGRGALDAIPDSTCGHLWPESYWTTTGSESLQKFAIRPLLFIASSGSPDWMQEVRINL